MFDLNTEKYDFRYETDEKQLERVGEILRNGGLVAIPTETVYGLAANAFDGEAVKKIFAAKGRPQDNPLIVHINALSQWGELVSDIPENARRLAEAYWPGPLTVILKKSDAIPDEVSAGLDTVAVRMPSHKTAAEIIGAAGVPLAAPSANISGKPSPTTFAHTVNDMDGKIDAIVDGGECDVGVESTVVSLAGDVPVLLRPGGITPKQLTDVLVELEINDAVYNKLAEGTAAASPGMKYMHYSPDAQVIILRGSIEGFCRYINENHCDGDEVLCFDGEEKIINMPCLCYGKREDLLTQAHKLFDALREFDRRGTKRVFVRCPDSSGVGLAVFNRLIRAAAFNLIDV